MERSERYMPLAYKLASEWRSKLASTQEDYEDLIGEALEALVRAGKDYSGTSEEAFGGYAARCIKNHFLNLLKARHVEKRALFRAYSFSALEHTDMSFDELYSEYCSYPEVFFDQVETNLVILDITRGWSKKERYLLLLRLKEYTGKECKDLYAAYIGKNPGQIDMTREMTKIRNKYRIYQQSVA